MSNAEKMFASFSEEAKELIQRIVDPNHPKHFSEKHIELLNRAIDDPLYDMKEILENEDLFRAIQVYPDYRKALTE